MNAPKILMVEDEADLVILLEYNLKKDGFRTATADNGEDAMLMLEEFEPDLVLLDWMLPITSGIEICRQIRRHKDFKRTPIIFLTARGEEPDMLRALESGADDYITKPFSPAELIARINAVLRRASPGIAEDVLEVGDLKLSKPDHRVTRDGDNIHLGPTEYNLLFCLMEQPGRVWSREQLLTKVWGIDSDIELRTVDVHIRRLRTALNQNERPDLIRTVRGAGYAIES